VKVHQRATVGEGQAWDDGAREPGGASQRHEEPDLARGAQCPADDARDDEPDADRGVEDDEDGPKAHAVGSSSARAASAVPVKSRLAIKPRALLLASRRRNDEASLLEVRTRLRQPA